MHNSWTLPVDLRNRVASDPAPTAWTDLLTPSSPTNDAEAAAALRHRSGPLYGDTVRTDADGQVWVLTADRGGYRPELSNPLLFRIVAELADELLSALRASDPHQLDPSRAAQWTYANHLATAEGSRGLVAWLELDLRSEAVCIYARQLAAQQRQRTAAALRGYEGDR